ncbi:unnamed protein product [Urochloa humidicola]
MASLRYAGAASPRCPLLGYQHQPSSVLLPRIIQWTPPRQSSSHLLLAKASSKRGGDKAVALQQAANGELLFLQSDRAQLQRELKHGAVAELEAKIRAQLLAVGAAGDDDGSPTSAYDTAWVAMVPATRGSSSRFPRCLDWILRNQHADGSWGLQLCHSGDNPSLAKDALSSTMACVLALATWGVGDVHIVKGLRFIGKNYTSCLLADDNTPAGFNVIFPGMLACGIAMGLVFPLPQADVDAILRLRDTELKSIMASGNKAFMAYVAEGMGDLLDWDQATMAYQRKNGSFNSPATTAAAAVHDGNNDRALDYLDSLVSKFNGSVPTVYPRNVYSRLRMVDTLEKMGISQSFSREISHILDATYRCWLDGDEEMMLDMATCAIAFHLLRMHGYDVSCDGLAQFSKESSFHDSIQGHIGDTEALLELFRASQVQMLEEELILQDIGSWSAKLLKQQLCSGKKLSVDPSEVEHALKSPLYATLERLEHRWSIEHFKTEHFQMLKSAYCLPPRADEEILAVAADRFHSSQAVYQQELQHLQSWVKEVRLDELEFAKVMPLPVLFSAAATMFTPELSEARMAWSKNSILTTVVDDLFDMVGSREEMENLVALIDRWDAHQEAGFCSERVEILFRAVYDTNTEIGAKAAAVQNRSVTDHIAELWADTVKAWMAEAEWRMSGRAPSSMEEYMAAGEPSFALGPIVPPSLYLVGPELPEGVVSAAAYGEMLRHMSVCGRLLNDLRTYAKESRVGITNSVQLVAGLRGGGGGSSPASGMEAAKRELSRAVEASRRELLRLVVRDGGAVPPPCRVLFWNMCKVLHLFYMEEDGYASPKEMTGAANAVLLQPLHLHCLLSVEPDKS